MATTTSQSPAIRIIGRLFIAQVTLLGFLLLLVVVLTFTGRTLGTFIFAFFAGGAGASLALMRRLGAQSRESLEELATSWRTTLMPLVFGGMMAAVTYCLFMSGILTGDGGSGLFTSNLFPNFKKPETRDDELLNMRTVLAIRPATVSDAGKLIVWCFVAGFSEKFVPGMLASLERKGGGESGKSGE